MSDDDLIAFIQSFIEDHSYAPSYREIGEACNIKSTSTVAWRIAKLEARGRLRRTVGVFRSIVVVKENVS